MKKIKQFVPSSFKGGKTFDPRAAEKAMYDSPKWREYSRKFLAENPKCYCCGAGSQVTDHIEAHKGRVELFWKVDNYLPLCFSCHNTITALFDRHVSQRYIEKLKWIANIRAKNDITIRVKVVPLLKSR